MPSVGSGTYSPGPNMRGSPGKEGSDGECRFHHWPCLSRSQKPCYSVNLRLVNAERYASGAANGRSDVGAKAIGGRLQAIVRRGLDVESPSEYLPCRLCPCQA